MRWVVLTPTFAAGLGVVVAAALAAPTRSVVLSTRPFKGNPCATPGCAPGGKGALAARPGTKPLVVPSRTPGPSAPSRHVTAHNVLVQYRTVGLDRNGGFVGQLILVSPGARPLGSWTLRFGFGYTGQIRWVWGRPPLPQGQHSVTVTSEQYPPGNGSGGHEVEIVFSASGPPGPPAICVINGHACRFTSFGGHSPGYGNPGGGGYSG